MEIGSTESNNEYPDPALFQPNCLSIDLEVGKGDGRIHAFAAIQGNTGRAVIHRRHGDLKKGLTVLDDLVREVDFLLGHNIIAFDLPHLRAADPALKLLEKPVIDTLRLNPLAFPRNPYHHLVKHYQDGQLKCGRLNDPELDARLTLTLFQDQYEALRKTAPELLTAWHWITTADRSQDREDEALHEFFIAVRGQRERPGDDEARSVIQTFLSDISCKTQVDGLLGIAARNNWALAYGFRFRWLTIQGSITGV